MNYTNLKQDELFKNWFGHELTENEYILCQAAYLWTEDWDLPIPDGIEETYEAATGKSCVYWGPAGDCDPSEEDLPRPEGYVTQGYTNGFLEWYQNRILEAVKIAGKNDVRDIWRHVRGLS